MTDEERRPNPILRHVNPYSWIKKGMEQVNPFSGTPFGITPEEAGRFKDRDPMELYRWHWQRLEEKGLLPHGWREDMENKLAGAYDQLRGDIKEGATGLLACKLALKEWQKKKEEKGGI